MPPVRFATTAQMMPMSEMLSEACTGLSTPDSVQVGNDDMLMRIRVRGYKPEHTGVKCRMNRMIKCEWVVTAMRQSPGR
jgi:hypothetical protein